MGEIILLCNGLCEEKPWEKFFSCAVRKTGHPWLVWPRGEEGWNRELRQVVELMVFDAELMFFDVELMSLKDFKIQQP